VTEIDTSLALRSLKTGFETDFEIEFRDKFSNQLLQPEEQWVTKSVSNLCCAKKKGICQNIHLYRQLNNNSIHHKISLGIW